MFFSVITTAFFLPSVVRISRAKRLTASPNGRTSHIGDVPSLGGVGIFAAMGMSVLLFVDMGTCLHCRFFLAGLFVVFFTGLKDDIFPLTPYKKLAGQLLAALLLVVGGGVYISDFQGLFGIYQVHPYVGMAVTVLFMLLITNSINLIDGIDGLAAGVGVLASLVTGIWFFATGNIYEGIISLTVMGSFATFIGFNISKGKYKIFLGDAGSLILGFSLAYLAIRFMELNLFPSAFPIASVPAVLVSVLIVPLFDTLIVFVVRIAIGKSPFEPDKLHIHHRLLFLLKDHVKVTGTIISVNLVFIVLTFTLQNLNLHWLVLGQLVFAGVLSYIPVFIIGRKNYNCMSVSVKREYEKVAPQHFNRKHPDGHFRHKARKSQKVAS